MTNRKPDGSFDEAGARRGGDGVVERRLALGPVLRPRAGQSDVTARNRHTKLRREYMFQ